MTRGSILRTLCLLLVFVMVGPLMSGHVLAAKDSAKGKDKPTTYELYFGDLHAHTGYSDAYEDSTPWQAYQAAIDAGADFMALTDHVQFWNAYDSFVMDEEEWQDTLDAADTLTSENFVAMAGYEVWMLANCGEVNVFNMRELPPTEKLGYRFDRLGNFYDWLAAQSGAVGQFNHPLYVSEDFMDYAYHTETGDAGMCVIEVYNAENYEPSYIKALDAGWHVLPSANSDTHYSDWIAAHEMRTVLLAESLTPESLYGAISACRGYGTLDKNLRIQYTLNGAVMGSVLPDSTVTSYTASIQIEDPDGLGDEITMVEIVTDGGEVIAWESLSSSSVDLTLEFESESARYFYLRVTTASPLNEEVSGVTAWTAPVWTGR